MSQPPPPHNPSNLLDKLAKFAGLLAAALYFTGWTYRWAYFAFFQIEVTSLNLPFESFLIVPLQVFFGNLEAFFRSILTIALALILIQLTLQIIQLLNHQTPRMLNWVRSRLIQSTINRRWRSITRILQIFPQFQPIDYDKSLIAELILVTWVLAILFFLPYYQGSIDARRDAVNNTSTLPVISLVLPADELGFGRTLNDLTLDPSPKDFRVIGDLQLYEQLIGRELNYTAEENEPEIVWRLLGDRNNKFYIFPALPQDALLNARPPVIVIQQSSNSDQLIIRACWINLKGKLDKGFGAFSDSTNARL